MGIFALKYRNNSGQLHFTFLHLLQPMFIQPSRKLYRATNVLPRLFSMSHSQHQSNPTTGPKVVLKDKLTESSKWYNELGSVMTITNVDGNGGFEGKYNSAVGTAEKQYKLVGRYDTEGRSLGWVVCYQNTHLNAHSTCAWSGLMDTQHDDPFKLVIHTSWLLTSEEEEEWNSTNVGFDTFTQDPPDEARIECVKRRLQCSHPKSA